MSVIRRWTEVNGITLLYPLTILALLLISRMQVFDRWGIAPSLVITLGIGTASLGVASCWVMITARRLRAKILRELTAVKEAAMFKPSEPNPSSAEAIARMISQLDSFKEGAFATWFHQPIFTALIVVVTLVASANLAEPLMRMIRG